MRAVHDRGSDDRRGGDRRPGGGLVQRVAQRLLALTLGILINVLAGRAPRALIAFDGR